MILRHSYQPVLEDGSNEQSPGVAGLRSESHGELEVAFLPFHLFFLWKGLSHLAVRVLLQQSFDDPLILTVVEGARAVDHPASGLEQPITVFDKCKLQLMQQLQLLPVEKAFLEVFLAPTVLAVDFGGVRVAVVLFELFAGVPARFGLVGQCFLHCVQELLQMLQRAFMGALGINQHSVIELILRRAFVELGRVFAVQLHVIFMAVFF